MSELPLPGLDEHPATRCVYCDSSITWQLIDSAELGYADHFGTTFCPDEDGEIWPHEPISGANDGVLWRRELAAYLDAKDREGASELLDEPR